MNFTEKEIFKMTLRKFYELYDYYKIYYDMRVNHVTFKQLEEKQAKDDEWL